MCIYSFSFLCLPITASVWARAPAASSASTLTLDCGCRGRTWARRPRPPREPRELPPSSWASVPKEGSPAWPLSRNLAPTRLLAGCTHGHSVALQRHAPGLPMLPLAWPGPRSWPPAPAQRSASGLSRPSSKFSLSSLLPKLFSPLCSLMPLSRGREPTPHRGLAGGLGPTLASPPLWSPCHSITPFYLHLVLSNKTLLSGPQGPHFLSSPSPPESGSTPEFCPHLPPACVHGLSLSQFAYTRSIYSHPMTKLSVSRVLQSSRPVSWPEILPWTF